MLIITIPFNYNNFFYFNYSLLLFLVINSFGVFALILTGISSYSKYTVLGSLRAVSQFISYEIVLSFIFLFIILVCSSFNFIDIIFYQQINLYLIYPFFPIFLIFFISILAETNRSPFDLPEAESELVSGYSTEYGASPFVFFFLAEYTNMVLWSCILVFFFLGGWFFSNLIILYNFYYFFFVLKILFVNFSIVWVRGCLPRYRFDNLISICWKAFLPFLIGYYVFIYYILLII